MFTESSTGYCQKCWVASVTLGVVLRGKVVGTFNGVVRRWFLVERHVKLRLGGGDCPGPCYCLTDDGGRWRVVVRPLQSSEAGREEGEWR